MQGSFWKTVALVAVIGVGSLALLEVQNRLKNSPSVLEASAGSDDADLARELGAVTETSVDADLSESDFDKMLKAGFPSTTQQTVAKNSPDAATGFELSEPGDDLDQAVSAGLDDSAAQFSLADINDQNSPGHQPENVAGDWESASPFGNGDVQLASSNAIDTNVDPNALTESPNPFAMMNDDTANNQTGAIQPAGFVAEEKPAFDAAPSSPFAAFDPTAASSTDNFPSAANSPSNGEASAAADAAMPNERAGRMQFYNGVERNESNVTPPKTVDASTIAFDQEFPADTFGGSADVGQGFQEFPANNGNVNSPSRADDPFSGFGANPEMTPSPRQPDLLPTPDGNMGNSSSPFFEEPAREPTPNTRELVPMPRDRTDSGMSFDSRSETPGSFNDPMSDSESLPFVEDGRLDVPVLNPEFNPEQDNGLAIPWSDQEPGPEPGRRTFDGNNFDAEPRNPMIDRNPAMDRDSDFDRNLSRDMEWDPGFDQPATTNPNRPEEFQPRTPERRDPAMNPIQNDPFGRTDFSREGSGSSLDRSDRTFGNERLDLPENRQVNPGFDAEPGRIPTMENRRNDLNQPLDRDSRDNRPRAIDPGFSSEFSGSNRRDSGSVDEDFGLNGSSRPVREFGGADNSRDFQNQPYDRSPNFGGNSGGSGPVRNDREFGGPSSNRRQENLRSVDDRMGGNIRQIASVMRPKLTLQKNAPENATVGTPLQYSITVRNDGDAPAYDVVVEDELTSSSRIDAAKPQASRSNDGERLVWEFDSIGPGEVEEIQVQVTPTGEGMIDGVATVKFKSRVKATTMITAPRLELKMEGPAKVRLGDKVQYRYVVTNEGSGEARSVFVRTVLPQNGGLRHPQGQDLEYEIPLMEPGEQREILLSVVAGEPGSQQAQALVTSRNGSKDQATWNTDVVGAQLQMLRRGPKRRFVSKTARYENIVTNETDFDAVNARVVERIPPGMEFKAAGQNGRYNPVEKTVTWEIRRLAAKATTTLQLELEPRVAGQQDSRVTIFENIGAQSDDYVSTTVVEDLHNVSATISQLDGPVALGEVFGFTIAVDNRGTAHATDIELSVEVPAEIEVFGAGTKDVPAGMKRGTNTVVYQKVVRIKPGEQQDFELKLRGVRPGRNKIVKASVKYTQMSEPLEISESVTIYDDRN